MGCPQECGSVPPILENPNKNEEILWLHLSRNRLDDPCAQLPRLDSPTDCEAAFLRWLRALSGCAPQQGACGSLPALMPSLDDCSVNLRLLTSRVVAQRTEELGAFSGGGGAGVSGGQFFVPPPCPTDDFERTSSVNVADPTHPWNERESVTDVFEIRSSSFPQGAFQSAFGRASHGAATTNRAGFMTFGGIGGGPINWTPDQEITFPSGTSDSLFNIPGPLAGKWFLGYGVRFAGTITNFTGYVLGKIFGYPGIFGSTLTSIFRLRNVNLQTDLSAQDIVHLTTLNDTSNFSDMTIVGQTITVKHIFPTLDTSFTDIFGIIPGGDGPGMVCAADFADATNTNLATIEWRNVCVKRVP